MKRKSKTALSILLSVCMILFLFGCAGKPAQDGESETTAAMTSSVYETYVDAKEETTGEPLTTAEKEAEQSTKKETAPAVNEQTQKETVPEESSSSKYTRTGESVFSDDPDNKYISAVASKYKLDKSLLAAVYTIPDADGNMVMEFDGTKDKNGKLVRDENTLTAIYTVDKNLNSKRASKDSKLNEYSSLESKTMFFTVTKYIIPKFQNEL